MAAPEPKQAPATRVPPTTGAAMSGTDAHPPGLGTFLGVFTPTILTILGVIMYLRFGWVLGQVGLAQTLTIVVLANLITIATAVSFSAIATNTRVGVGGAYFIISRSLGLEVGGAIGLPLFLSQAFSITLYAFGLAESLRILWPGVPLQPVALGIVLLVGALALRGAGFALKVQIPVMALIGVSVAALAIGATSDPLPVAALEASHSVGFWAVFAVFFPAVTGVMAGLGLSGDLRDPGRAIPLGSISAALTGLIIYLAVPVLLAMGADGPTLRDDALVWTRVAPLGAWLIFPGLLGAIFSSAIGSMLGAPRTLQALAQDRIAPSVLARGRADGGEPRAALAVSLALAVAAVFLGDLNSVATVVTMFFLTVYGMVNLAAALETLFADVSWRPRLRAPWPVSLAAAVACFVVMFLISPVASVVAIAVEVGLWIVLGRMDRATDWGDARRDVYEGLIRWALLGLGRRPMTARNWRPHLLLFRAWPNQGLGMLRFASWFSRGRGVMTVCDLLVGDLLDDDMHPTARRAELHGVLSGEGLVAFPEAHVVRSVEEGIIDVAQANGMAGLESNTVILCWRDQPAELAELLRVMRRLECIHKSVLIGRADEEGTSQPGARPVVDIWWGGLQRNGDLMLLLAHLLTRNAAWRRADVRVLSIAPDEQSAAETRSRLATLLSAIRIDAEPRVIVQAPGATIQQTIQAESSKAQLVLFGLASPPPGEDETYAARLIELAGSLPRFFFVKNASLFVGELMGADEVH